MDKYEYFKLAVNSGACLKVNWLLNAFAITNKEPLPTNLNSTNYPYQIFNTNAGWYFANLVSNKLTLERIDVSAKEDYLFDATEEITVTKLEVPNLTENKAKITVGGMLGNYLLIVYPLKSKIPYMGSKLSIKSIEAIIAKKLKNGNSFDNTSSNPNNTDIYIDEYLSFTDGCSYLNNLCDIISAGPTEKMLMTSPKMEETKSILLDKYKDTLDDPVTIAHITEELIKLDKEWLSDDPIANVYLSEKEFTNSRKKMFGIGGIETSFDDDGKISVVKNSLNEGWVVGEFDTYINSLRMGYYNRSTSVIKGGVLVKGLNKVTGGMEIDMDDCGTKLGNVITITKNDIEALEGFWYIENGETKELTKNILQAYLGNEILIRSPMYCNAKGINYCSKCCGPNLSRLPKAVGAAITETGSIIMLIFMKKMHQTVSKTVPWTPDLIS